MGGYSVSGEGIDDWKTILKFFLNSQDNERLLNSNLNVKSMFWFIYLYENFILYSFIKYFINTIVMIKLLKLLLMLCVEFKYKFVSSSNWHGVLLTQVQAFLNPFWTDLTDNFEAWLDLSSKSLFKPSLTSKVFVQSSSFAPPINPPHNFF